MIKGALQSKKANIHKSNNYKSNQIKCWFLRRGENRSTRRKTSWSRVENQQTQPTYDAKSGNRTRATLVKGECSTTAPTLLPRVFIFQLLTRFTCIKFSFLLEGIFLSHIVLIVSNKNDRIRMQYLSVCQEGSQWS